MKFDERDIERRDFVVLDDLIFLEEDEAVKYIDTCDARLETEMFVPNVKAMMRDFDKSEESLRDGASDKEFKEMVQEYDETVADLLDTYEIEYFRKGKGRYILTGKYEDLKEFAKQYSNDIVLEYKGSALSDCATECDIDIDSGDEDYILGRLSG